jgi:hypothetical protein
MATPLRLSRTRAEEAIAAFIKAKLADAPAPAPDDCPVFIRQGEVDDNGSLILDNPDDIPLPSIVVSATQSQRHAMGYSVVQLHVMVCGGTDGEDAAEKHDTLAGYVAAIFGEENRNDVCVALSPPIAGPDNRAVKEFRAFGYLLTDEFSQQSGRAWIDDVVYEFHCQPTDDTSG